MKKLFILFLSLLTFFNIFAQERLKNLITIKGVRENPVIGYGLVIGLNGTGDSAAKLTNQSLGKIFKRLGLNVENEISSKNVASVMVTAKLPPFARVGQKIDVTVSSISDASSLAGGNLLVTALKGGNSEIYAMANGAISIGGLNKGIQFPTTGIIPEGAIIEKEIDLNFDQKRSLRINLKNPDFTTAHRVEKTLNKELGGRFAIARDASTLDLIVPNQYQRNVVELLALIENFKVFTDVKAKIVVNERTGTIVAGGDIRLHKVAISHGDLTIKVGEEGEEGQEKSVYHIQNGASLNDLVGALNTLGTTPEDLMAILQTMKKNGMLIGELEFI